MCLHNIHLMQKQYEMLRKADIVIICVFRSPPANISKFAYESTNGMLALSDKSGAVYKSYKVKNSVRAFMKGEADQVKYLFKKYKAHINVRNMMKDFSLGGAKLLPADYLINEDG